MWTGRFIASAAAMVVGLGGIALPVTALFAAADQVRVTLVGELAASCSNNIATQTLDAGDLTKPGSKSFTFTVDCNAPFSYAMQSANGAFRLIEASADLKQSPTQLPYEIAVTIPLTGGGKIIDRCQSAALKTGAISCKFTNSGDKIALNQTATAEIAWQAPASLLAAGKYQDQLTISISARL